MYDERYYNLSTLLELYKNSKPDPFTRNPLKLAGISPARTLLNNFDKVVLELNKNERQHDKMIPIITLMKKRNRINFYSENRLNVRGWI